MLEARLKHQQAEVLEATRNLGEKGFSKAYLRRMQKNVEQTKRLIRKYRKS